VVTPNPPPLQSGVNQPTTPNNPNAPVVTGGMPPNNMRMGSNNLGLGTNQMGIGTNQFAFRTNRFGTNSLRPLTPTGNPNGVPNNTPNNTPMGTNNNRILLQP